MSHPRWHPLVLALAAGVACAWTSDARSADRVARTVLTIHQGAPSFPSNPVIDTAVREALLARATMPIDYFTEYREVDSLPPAQADAPFAEYVGWKYRDRRIDVVIAVTDTSLQFAIAHRADLFPDAAIVYMGLIAPDERVRAAGAGITGVRVGTAYGESLRAALAIHPDTEQVFVIANSPNPEAVALVREDLHRAAPQLRLVYVDDTVSGMIDQVRAAPARSL